MGHPLALALLTPASPCTTPGPDTVSSTPGTPVRNPAAEAAYPAACSLRQLMKRMPQAWAADASCVTGMPMTPNMWRTPRRARALATRKKPSLGRGAAAWALALPEWRGAGQAGGYKVWIGVEGPQKRMLVIKFQKIVRTKSCANPSSDWCCLHEQHVGIPKCCKNCILRQCMLRPVRSRRPTPIITYLRHRPSC